METGYIKWLRWVLIIGLCAVPFVAFIVADGTFNFHLATLFVVPVNMFFPYITGKNFTFRILVEVLFAVYVLLAIREPKYRPRSSLIMWALCAFLIWGAISTAFSVDPVKSFWSNFERMDGYITQLHLFALFIMAGAVLTAEKWWERLFQISVAGSMLQGIYAIFQAFGIFGLAPSSQSGARADTTFGNATYLAVYMLFNLFLTLYLLYRERKNAGAWWMYVPALVLQFAGLYFTETRGAMLGFIGGVILAAIYIALFAKGSDFKSLRTWSLWGLGGIVVLIAVFLGIRNTSFIKNSPTLERFASISLTDDTTHARFLIWEEAWQGFKEKPLIGWGMENFSYVFNNFYNPQMYAQEQWFDRAHNAFIDWAIDGGAPAFLLYVSLFALAAYAFYESELEVPEQAIFIGLLAGYAFNNLTVFDNITSYIYFFLILAFAHGLSHKKLPGWMFMSTPLGDQAVAVMTPILLVVLIWGGYELNGPGIARAQTLIDALTTVNEQTGAARDPSENLAAFQTALGQGELGRQEVVEQLFQFSSNNIANDSSISPAVKQQAFTETETAADALMKQRPNDARLELFYGVFLDQFGQYPEALAKLQEALKDSPDKQQILFEIGDTYIASGDYPDALPPLEQAYNEVPAYQQAALMYAEGLYYNNDNTQADALLLKSYGTTTIDDQTLMQTYYTTKQYTRLASIYQLLVAQNPNDVQSLVGEAVMMYFATHNTAAAVAALQKVATDQSAYATQIQSIIDEINAGTLTP